MLRHQAHAAAAEQGRVWEDLDVSWQISHQRLRAEASKRGRLFHGMTEDKLPNERRAG